MKIEKKLVYQMEFPYAVAAYECSSGVRVACATETTGAGISFSALDCGDIRTLWTGPGGTMTICPMGEEDFLVTHRFFKRFQSQDAVVTAVTRQEDGTWKGTEVLKLPYLHRFCIVNVGEQKWMLGGTLCDRKDSFEDWSHAGGVYVGKISDDLRQPLEVREIYHGIHKNHGMFHGLHNGKEVAIVTGQEGAFEITPPEDPEGIWGIEQLLDTEISDIRVFDLDGDGKDELITIEGFHGDRLKVYHESEGTYRQIYEYPIAFGHGLWCGLMLGRRTILIGYKNANGALVALQMKKGPEFSMDITVIDELEQVANLDVYDAGDDFYIYAACSIGNINLYKISNS